MSDSNNLLKNISSDPLQMKQFILNLITPECKEVANGLFDCLENKLQTFDLKGGKFEDVEKRINETIIPECFNNFNLDDCLAKNDKI
jgi:hypothetical protein